MVSENYKAQLKWFTKKLIEIRISPATDGLNEPIDFDLALITSSSSPDFDTIGRSSMEHAERMLDEIRAVLSLEKETHPAELKWRDLGNGHIKIYGFTTALLRKYLKEIFDETFHLFGEAQDERRKTVLTYLGQHTDILLSGKQLAVFRCLLKKFGKTVTFEELCNAIGNQNNIVRGQAVRRTELVRAFEAEKVVVHSAVGALKQKLKEASGNRYREIIEGSRGEGYAMII